MSITGPDVVSETGVGVEYANEVPDELKEEHKDGGAVVLEEDEVDKDGGDMVSDLWWCRGRLIGIVRSCQSMVTRQGKSTSKLVEVKWEGLQQSKLRTVFRE